MVDVAAREVAIGDGRMARHERWAVLSLAAVGAVVFGLLVWMRCVRPDAGGFEHGDPTTDANIIIAGRNFEREGFCASWGVPALDTYRGEGKRPDYYTTYPPGAYWWHVGLRSVGVKELRWFRLVALLLSGCAAAVLFAGLRRVSGSAGAASLATGMYILSRPFVEYVDNLHYIALGQVTLFGALYCWVRGMEVGPRNHAGHVWTWVGACAAVYFVDCWITFEHTVFVLFVGAAHASVARRWRMLGAAVGLAVIPVVVLGVRVLMNAQVLGGIDAAMSALGAKFSTRTGLAGAGGGVSLGEVARAWLPRLGWGTWAGGSAGTQDGEFVLPVLSWGVLVPTVLLVMVAAWKRRASSVRRHVRMLLAGAVLLIGGATWFVGMQEHSVVHRFVVMLMLPGAAALAAGLCAMGLGMWRTERGAARWAGPGAAVALLVACVAPVWGSLAFNRVVAVDAAAARVLHAREEFARLLGRRSGVIAGINRLYMMSHDSSLMLRLGVPFDNQPGRVRSPLAAGEAQHVWWHDPAAAARVIEALPDLGLPEMFSAPADGFFFFVHKSAEERAGEECNLHLEGGFRVESLRVTRTLDGGRWLVRAVVAPSNVSAPEERPRMVVRMTEGNEVYRRAAHAEVIEGAVWGGSGQRGLVWAIVPRVYRDSGVLRVAFRAHGAAMRIEAGAAEGALPSNAKVGANGRHLLIDTDEP